MFKTLGKPTLLAALLGALALSLTAGSAGGGGTLCNQDSTCSDNGCNGDNGICGAKTEGRPCICFF